jgi:predicted RNA-binding protein with TRAM domain
MAILTQVGDQYEVRIKRHSDQTYFDEHVKVGDQYEVRIKRHSDQTYFDEHVKVGDKPGATSCARYIIGEQDVIYSIELTLPKGFNFGDYERVRMELYFPGQSDEIAFADAFKPLSLVSVTTQDIQVTLEYADVKINGRKMLGTQFSFRGLSSGMSIFEFAANLLLTSLG